MNPSPTVEALAPNNDDSGYTQSYPMKTTQLRPTHTLTLSQSSTITCNSTANLVKKGDRKGSGGGFSCWRRKQKTSGAKTMEEGLPTHGKEPVKGTSMWMGWRLMIANSS